MDTEPCLACGRPVHVVAGHCRHCRADLVALRADAARAARIAAVREQVAADPLLQPVPPPAHPHPPGRSSWPSVLMTLAAALLVLAGSVGAGFAADRLFLSP